MVWVRPVFVQQQRSCPAPYKLIWGDCSLCLMLPREVCIQCFRIGSANFINAIMAAIMLYALGLEGLKQGQLFLSKYANCGVRRNTASLQRQLLLLMVITASWYNTIAQPPPPQESRTLQKVPMYALWASPVLRTLNSCTSIPTSGRSNVCWPTIGPKGLAGSQGVVHCPWGGFSWNPMNIRLFLLFYSQVSSGTSRLILNHWIMQCMNTSTWT